MISHTEERGIVRARVHHMFLDAPPRVQDALVRYMREGDREASDLVGRYIDVEHAAPRARVAQPAPRDAGQAPRSARRSSTG